MLVWAKHSVVRLREALKQQHTLLRDWRFFMGFGEVFLRFGLQSPRNNRRIWQALCLELRRRTLF